MILCLIVLIILIMGSSARYLRLKIRVRIVYSSVLIVIGVFGFMAWLPTSPKIMKAKHVHLLLVTKRKGACPSLKFEQLFILK